MRNVFILGDSYSTFAGYIPEGYSAYYPNLDVSTVEQTWWMRLLLENGDRLLQNNSWSGSTVGYTGYDGIDCSKTTSFIYRYKRLKADGFFRQNHVDVIYIFGGTNDDWCGAPLGEPNDEPNEQALYFVLPAVCWLFQSLKADLPETEVIFILNTGFKTELTDGICSAASRYGIKCVKLRDIDKIDGHPTAKGMADIARQITEGERS